MDSPHQMINDLIGNGYWGESILSVPGIFPGINRKVKVQWEHYGPEEATWELEDAMRLAHPFLFNSVKH